jgi:hypothetical protein
MRGTACNRTISNSKFEHFDDVARIIAIDRQKWPADRLNFFQKMRGVNELLRRMWAAQACHRRPDDGAVRGRAR